MEAMPTVMSIALPLLGWRLDPISMQSCQQRQKFMFLVEFGYEVAKKLQISVDRSFSYFSIFKTLFYDCKRDAARI